MKDFLKKFELYLGSIFISVTICVVIMNVFTRYVLKFTYFWAEEVAVGCFVWTIFLGTAAAYRQKALIGVEALVVLLPKKIRKIVEASTSSKITVALEISYAYINTSIILAFGLMTIYSLIFTIESFRDVIKKENKD